MKNSGFKNEKNLVTSLHQKRYTQLNSNLQKFIAQSFKNYSGIILCEQEAGINKSDLRVSIGEESHSYSVKKGSGNSIHQESIDGFIDYLTKEHNLSKRSSENLQRFIWADGSIDGTGKIEEKNFASQQKYFKRLGHYRRGVF